MKVITEAVLRNELRGEVPESYTIEEGKILSPAAREYLQQRKIKILDSKMTIGASVTAEYKNNVQVVKQESNVQVSFTPQYVDYESGAYYIEKPEHMTQLTGNVLVAKNHKRIIFRGKLDSLQALIVLNQAILHEENANKKLIDELSNILGILREMMRCDVLDEPFSNSDIIGLSHAQLREQSHNPMKFFKIKQMLLPDFTMGKAYAMLNQLRTAIRETEVLGTNAFMMGSKQTRTDIIEELNRLSSALHIMMCKYLAGEYPK